MDFSPDKKEFRFKIFSRLNNQWCEEWISMWTLHREVPYESASYMDANCAPTNVSLVNMVWLKICGSMASSSQFTGLIFSHSCEAIKRRKANKRAPWIRVAVQNRQAIYLYGARHWIIAIQCWTIGVKIDRRWLSHSASSSAITSASHQPAE